MTDSRAHTVLLTGFAPFGGETTNPSWSAVREVQRAWSGPEQLHVRELPVEFGAVDAALVAAINEVAPDVIICVGQAGGSASLAVERVAINVDDARIPDNAGAQPIDEPVVEGGPAAYWSTLPIKAAVAELSGLGIPAVVSQTAGTFTCNHVFYRLMHEMARSERRIPAGFVHVPFSPEQAPPGSARPSMPIETMAQGIAAVLGVALTRSADVELAGGALH